MSTQEPRRRDDSDFAEEIRSHVEHEADDLIAAGVDRDEAFAVARRRFGNITAAQERFHEAQRWMVVDRLRQDVRDATRAIVRYPIASAVAILSMAAGIGVATVTLTIRNVVFHNPPILYTHPAELSQIQVAVGARPITPIGSYPPGALYRRWQERLGTGAIAAAVPSRGVRDVRVADRTESVPVRSVSPELFDLLGVELVAGRTFTRASSEPSPAVLSHRLWKLWFDARPDAIGQTIWIENGPHTVIGVLPAGFWFSEMQSAVWTRIDPRTLATHEALEVVARRPTGVTPEAFASELHADMTAFAATQPGDSRQMRLKISPVEGTPAGKQMSILLPWVLGISALLTLLIACANVAVLTIAQWTTREHEISIRASLGANRARLVRALLTESMMIAVAGGVLGIGATLGLRLLMMRAVAADGEGFMNLEIPARVFAQCAATTLAAGMLIGLAPALFETRRLLGNPMRANATTDRLRQRWRHALVVLEIGVTVALLVVASAFINASRRAMEADMGFATGLLISTEVRNPKGVPLDQMVRTIGAVPGVAAVAAATSVPFTTRGPRASVAIDAAGSNAVNAERASVTPEFFSTLGVSLRAGRTFTATDAANDRIAVVNLALALKLFGSADAVGRTLVLDGRAHDVVGVAANYSNQPFFREYDPRVFVPLDTASAPPRANFVVRAVGDPAPLVETIRRTVRDAAPGNVSTNAVAFDTIRTISSQEVLVGTAPLAPLIAIGLLLTAAGIYGVLAFAIARRSRELAVRVAIGASGRDLVRLVAGHSSRLIGVGASLGLALTFALGRVVRASGGAGSPFDADWTAFITPAIVIVVVGALATWVPSRRLRKIDPAEILRSQI